MDKICPICFEEMEMSTFQDERQSTETCFKLQCNHAFHTKCIVECLQRTDHSCPSCNKHKTLEEKLTEEGIVRKLIGEVKKIASVRDALKESVAARNDLSETFMTLKKDTKAYAKQRAEELKLKDKQNYMTKCIATVKKTAVDEAKKKSPMHFAAMNKNSSFRRANLVELCLLGYTNSYQLYRLKHPYISFAV
jgi:hypothetical protein